MVGLNELMRSLAIRALLISIGLCVLALLLGLFPGSGSVLWIFWVPGTAAVVYPWNAIQGGFDAEMHPWAATLTVLADVLFWWLVIYVLLRLWRARHIRRQAQ